MRAFSRVLATLVACIVLAGAAAPSAYNGHPKLVVVIVIDQFRGDYLERFRDRFGEGGFRLFLDHGAYFTECNYNYANTRTAPGHATLFTGSYSNGHGIISNGWWDPRQKREIAAVQDDATRIVGVPHKGPGISPHNLLSDTLGDELKMATQGKARVFAVALKDRAAVLPGGFAADGAYWIDQNSGAWITSTYYRSELPGWVKNFNESKRTEKYLDREWKDSAGNVLRTTAPRKNGESTAAGFYEVVGSTPLANDYELEFARELVVYEHLGSGPATDLLSISLSANDIVGHQYGPDSPEIEAMTLATDRQLAEFFTFLGHQVGLANVWIALSADHGVAPLPTAASKLRIPAANLDGNKLRAQLNAALNARFSPGKSGNYVSMLDYPLAFLDESAFAAVKAKEEDAERVVGEAMRQLGFQGYFTRFQLAQGSAPDTPWGRKYLNSYSPEAPWFVLGFSPPFHVGSSSGTDHASPYTYDTHVPLAFYGLVFQTGAYRQHAEPVDLAVTLASLLGINAPSHAVGRVLSEALAAPREARPASSDRSPGTPPDASQPASGIRSGAAQ